MSMAEFRCGCDCGRMWHTQDSEHDNLRVANADLRLEFDAARAEGYRLAYKLEAAENRERIVQAERDRMREALIKIRDKAGNNTVCTNYPITEDDHGFGGIYHVANNALKVSQ